MDPALEKIKAKALRKEALSAEDLNRLIQAPLAALSQAACEIRDHHRGDRFDWCAILSVKSGHCSEDCAFCAQSRHHSSGIPTWPLVSFDQLEARVREGAGQGLHRLALVSSGRSLSGPDLEKVCDLYRQVGERSDLELCASHGLLGPSDLLALKEAGVSCYHHNLESSESYFPKICTSHTYQDRVRTIKAAQGAGLRVCSGGIFGLGESMADRLDLALSLRRLGIQSVPLNLFNPIPGTPLAGRPPLAYESFCRTVAIFRFILPEAFLRLAGGRILLPDGGKKALEAGINAMISGDMLTTPGAKIEKDRALVAGLGFQERGMTG